MYTGSFYTQIQSVATIMTVALSFTYKTMADIHGDYRYIKGDKSICFVYMQYGTALTQA